MNNDQQWSFIFGTMHTWDLDLFPPLDWILKYIDIATNFYTEIDIDKSIQSSKLQEAFLAKNDSLTVALGDKKFKKTRRILLKSFGVDILQFNNVLPMITLNQLTLSNLNDNADLPMDHTLWNLAKSKNKMLGGLESIDSQIDILHFIPWSYQLKQLVEVSKQVKKYKLFVKKLISLYASTDVNQLTKETQKSLGKYKHLMLKNRNIGMVSSIVENHDISAFYAIGAAHLGGFNGVIKMLKDKDYMLEPLSNS